MNYLCKRVGMDKLKLKNKKSNNWNSQPNFEFKLGNNSGGKRAGLITAGISMLQDYS